MLFVCIELHPIGIANVYMALLLVLLVICCAPLNRALSCRPLRWVGKVSMSVYLLHLFVIYTYTCRIAGTQPSTAYTIFIYVSTVALSLLVAWLFTRFVDPWIGRLTTWTMALLSNG